MGMKEDCAPSHKSYATSVYTYSYGGAKPTHINAPTILTQTHAHRGMKWREKGLRRGRGEGGEERVLCNRSPRAKKVGGWWKFLKWR